MGTKRHFATRTLPEPVPLVFEDDAGKRITELFTVKYRSFSPSFSREMSELEKGEDASLARSLGKVVISIVDLKGAPITDETGDVATIGEAFFDQMSANDNLKAIYDRITADVSFQPATSSASAPSPATSDSEEIKAVPSTT